MADGVIASRVLTIAADAGMGKPMEVRQIISTDAMKRLKLHIDFSRLSKVCKQCVDAVQKCSRARSVAEYGKLIFGLNSQKGMYSGKLNAGDNFYWK
jgi:hypothetical protein